MTLPYDQENIFAKILRGEIPCYRIYEDEIAFAFLDIMPRSDGHTLVLPKEPVRGFLDLSPQILGPYMERVQKIARLVVQNMEAEGFTLQQFNEVAGGQEVFHLHFHILPRWHHLALRPPGKMADQAVLEAHARKIRGEG